MSEAPISAVGRKVAVSAALMVLLRVAFRIIGVISTLILVRLLQPADFGLVGLATITYSVLDTLSDFSFEIALLRMKAPDRTHYDTAWTLGVVRGIIVAVCLAASAPLLVDLMSEPRVQKLTFVLAAVALLQSFQNIGIVDFQRELKFDRVFWFRLIGKLAGTLVTIPLAFTVGNYWALIIGLAAGRLVLVPLSYIMHPYRPRPSIAAWHDLIHFSKWLVVGNIQAAIDGYSTAFVLSRVGGAAQLGLYQVAYDIAALPASEIAAPARQPLYAGYARVMDDLAALRGQYLGGLSLTLALIVPASVGIYLMAEPTTVLVLGPKWSGAVPMVRLIALFALLEAVSHSTIEVFTVLNRQRRLAAFRLLQIVIRFAALGLGGYFGGAIGAVQGMLATAVVNTVMMLMGLGPLIGMTLRDLARATGRTLLATSGMVVTVLIVLEAWPSTGGLGIVEYIRFFSICAVGAVAQIVVQGLLWRAAGSPQGSEAHIAHALISGVRRVKRMLRWAPL